MRETLTRLLSGIVYILLLAAAIFYSAESFLLLFGVFLMISVVEFCSLVQLKKTLPLIVAGLAYFLFAVFPATMITLHLLLVATLFVSVRCIAFLFDDKAKINDDTTKFIYLIGYIILPFILLAKIPFQDIFYQP